MGNSLGQMQLSQNLDSGAGSQPTGMEPSVEPILDAPSLRIWPIILIILGAMLETVSIGMFVRSKTEVYVG